MPELLTELDSEGARWITAARSGDPDALDRLVERSDRWVRGAVWSVLRDAGAVDDVVQDVWLAACRKLGQLEDVERWRPWLFRLAKNTAIDALRRRGRWRRCLDGLGRLLESRTPHAPAPDQGLEDEEACHQVLAKIERLPEIYREVLVLRHLEDWSYARIAEVLDVPAATVETRLVRARRILRRSIGRR